MKKQVIIVSGGTSFNSHEDYIYFLKTLDVSLEYLRRPSWKDSLQEKLGPDFDVINLQMPNKTNAKYLEWKIYFERFFSLFDDEVILIGHSLGGLFLAKYLAENKYQNKIRSLYLIATPHSGVKIEESLGDFILPKSLEKVSEQSKHIYILHSEDDPIVPKAHADKYKNELPKAEVIIFKDKEHFNQMEFPELVDQIKYNF